MIFTLKLLNVEDDPADFLLLQRHLRQHGLKADCTRVCSKEELVAALDREPWDLVISDYSLPGQAFHELLGVIRERLPDEPVILFSGSIGEEAAVDLLKAGVWDFVLKDNPARLVPAIERSLREAEDRWARNAAEKALRESEARFRALVETTFDWTWEIDAAGHYSYASPKIIDLLGYTPKEVIGKTPFDLMPAAEAERVSALFAEIVAGHLPFNALENLNYHKDGRLVLLETSGMPIIGPSGELLGYRGNDRDITQRRLAESGLRESEEKYRRLVEGLQDEYFFYQHDANGVFTYLSNSITNILGFSPDEFKKHYKESLTDAPINQAAIQFTDRSLGGEQQPMYEVEVWHKNGSRRRLEVLENPLKDTSGQVVAIDGFAHDITRRYAIEQELQLRGEALKAAANAITITDAEGNIQWANPAYFSLTGFQSAEVVGHNPRELVRSGVQSQAFYAELWQTIKSGEVWHGELINRRKDGTRYVEDMTIAPVLDEYGAIRHFVSVGFNISERKAAESELAVYREHLEELVADRTAELDVARRDAELLARVKAEFLANMSHEIRTPLNAVLGFAQIGHKESANRKSQHYFSQILDSGELLLGIINDILDFSKIEAGKLLVEQLPIDLHFAIERAGALVAPRAHDKGLQWAVGYAADLPAGCLGDSLRLTQILINLLSNAVKFTEHGGVTLTARRDNDSLLFSVTDSGMGIDADQQARLFKAFEQADSTTTRRFGGTGLGLAISHRLAHLMGGEIEVDSASGVGSTFSLRLPYMAAEAPQRVAASTADGPRLVGLSILVAEDNEVNQLVLAELLAPDLPRLQFVENGRLAVERMAAEPKAFDVILMDIQMPEMDGYEAARRILARHGTVPIIGLTAYALAEEREKVLAAGMVAHVTKPIQLDELVAVILGNVALRRSPSAAEKSEQSGAAPAVMATVSPKLMPDAGVVAAIPVAEGGALRPPIDWAALDARYENRPEFVIKLLNLALQSNADTARQLRAAAHACDVERIAFLSHTVKGIAGNLFAEPLRELALAAELAARNRDPDVEARTLVMAAGVEQLLTSILDRLSPVFHQERHLIGD